MISPWGQWTVHMLCAQSGKGLWSVCLQAGALSPRSHFHSTVIVTVSIRWEKWYKNHSIHPRALRIICYHTDHPVVHSTAQERNLYLGDWERREQRKTGKEEKRERIWRITGEIKQNKPLEASYPPWQATQQPWCERLWQLYSGATQHTRAVGLGTQQLHSASNSCNQEDPSWRCPWGHVFMSCLGNW